MNLKQLWALVRLRFQLTFNQVKKGGRVNAILFAILAVAFVLVAVSSFFTAIAAGVILLPNRESNEILALWNIVVAVFIGMWSFHVMNRVQQNDAISVEKLLHLPVTFRGAFLLNYLETFSNVTFLTFAPLIIGLAVSMPFARGSETAVAIPLSISFLFMVTAITWQLRSWLAMKMQNKRMKGFYMALLPLAFAGGVIAIAEFTDSGVLGSLKETKLGWLPSGIFAAESGNWVSGLLGTLAMTAIGCGSMLLAFKSSLRRFTGATSSNKSKAGVRQGAETKKKWLASSMFSSLPGVSTAVSGIAMGTITGLRKAPEVFSSLIPLLVLTVFGVPYLIGMEGYVIPKPFDKVLPMGLIAVALLGFPAFLFSTFSYDRDGFRAYVLSPVERKDVLFGKNLAIGIGTVILGWLTMVVLQCAFPVGVFWFLGGMVCLVPAFLLMCIIGNAISVFFPVGLKRGSMTPVNSKVIPLVLLFAGILIGPGIALLPTALSFSAGQLLEMIWGKPMGWLFLLLSIVQLIAVWMIYQKSLAILGPRLWQRESELLEVVANIPE